MFVEIEQSESPGLIELAHSVFTLLPAIDVIKSIGHSQ